MKKIFLILFNIFLFALSVQAEPSKVSSVVYDNFSNVIYINSIGTDNNPSTTDKLVKLSNPNRLYFDIQDSVLLGSKQELVFEKSHIKNIKIAQFSTNPNVVRTVITFEEDYDTSKVKLHNINGNIVVETGNIKLKNDYFNTLYDESQTNTEYSSIVVNSQVIQKVKIPVNTEQQNQSTNVMNDIQKAFNSSTLNNAEGDTLESSVLVDLSSNLKLRTKYYINGYYTKNCGLLISGFGQMTAGKMFTLDSPKRVVIDLPNTYVDKKFRNKELQLCPDGSCKDSAKIGQFEYNKARIVVTTDTPEKYIPIYSADSQSMLLINADKLNHTTLVNIISNITKGYVNKLDSKTSQLILSFTEPVVHSIVRDNNSLTVYMFNVKSYNEPDLIKTFNQTYFKRLTISLLPQIGVKASMKIAKDDIVKIDQSVDGKALRIILTQSDTKQDKDDTPIISPKKTPIKNKVVLDPGHGGSDYGAIREGINEKDITLDITQRVASILKSKGYKVALTRSDDIYLGLQERCDYTDTENPEIFVSIHVNSAVATEPYGIETHYYHEHSKSLAEIIQKHLTKEIETKDRGVFKSKFYVINHTDVPAVLVETGFLSNVDERTELLTDKRKQKTAKAIADAIIEYLKSNK